MDISWTDHRMWLLLHRGCRRLAQPDAGFL